MDESMVIIETPGVQEKRGGKGYYFFLICSAVICVLVLGTLAIFGRPGLYTDILRGKTHRVAVAEWYSGGNLHRENLASWSTSAHRNRLATSADVAAIVLKGRFSSMDELKVYAIDMKNCIDEVAVESQLGSQQVAAVAASCAILLGW